MLTFALLKLLKNKGDVKQMKQEKKDVIKETLVVYCLIISSAFLGSALYYQALAFGCDTYVSVLLSSVISVCMYSIMLIARHKQKK